VESPAAVHGQQLPVDPVVTQLVGSWLNTVVYEAEEPVICPRPPHHFRCPRVGHQSRPDQTPATSKLRINGSP
jgi:hypothetical protein